MSGKVIELYAISKYKLVCEIILIVMTQRQCTINIYIIKLNYE